MRASYATRVSLDALLGVGAIVGVGEWDERVEASERRGLDVCKEQFASDGVAVGPDSTLAVSEWEEGYTGVCAMSVVGWRGELGGPGERRVAGGAYGHVDAALYRNALPGFDVSTM